MKAAVNTRYGGPEVIEIRDDVPKPEPGTGEVLVKVHATTVSRSDCGLLRAHPFFIRAMTGVVRPKWTVLGLDYAGEVEAVGTGVNLFAPGDRIFGLTPGGHGGHAEYLCVPESGAITTIPPGLPYHEAVLCEGAWYADNNLRAFGIRPGDKILIYGGSGAIGTAAVQLAKAYGADVTAVVGTTHLELVRSLGAARVVDYTAQDYTMIGDTFDYLFDAVGKVDYFKARRLLKPGGVFAATDLGPHGQNLLLITWSRVTRSRRVIFPLPKDNKTVVEHIRARVEAGELRAVIDRRYPLDAIVEAYRYVETKQKTGIVVIDVAAGADSVGSGAPPA